METKEWLILAGLSINIFATFLVVARARISIEHRITALETSMHFIENPIQRPQEIKSTPETKACTS